MNKEKLDKNLKIEQIKKQFENYILATDRDFKRIHRYMKIEEEQRRQKKK